jgi:F-type H+-transporting ATPase subunit b
MRPHALPQLAADEPNPILPQPAELIVGLVAFLLLLWLLWKFALPQFERAFQARVEAIEGGLKKAEDAQAEANRLLEQYRGQLNDARTEAAQIREGARADAQRITDEMRAQAQAEQARIVARGEEQLASQRQQLVRELRAEVGTFAVELAGRLIGDSLADPTARQRTVDAFLDEVDGMAQSAEPATVGAASGAARGTGAASATGSPATGSPATPAAGPSAGPSVDSTATGGTDAGTAGSGPATGGAADGDGGRPPADGGGSGRPPRRRRS